MADPTRGWTRALRCGVLAAVVVALATVAHVLGGGAEPGWAFLLALFAATSVPCAVVTARRLPGPGLVVIVAVGESALHHALMLGAGTATLVGDGQAGGGMAAHQMASVGDMAHTTPMLIGHAVAAALTALVLTYGERVCWQLCLGWPRVRLLFAIRLPAVPRRPIPAPDAGSFRPYTGLGGARVLRGPPGFDVC